MKLVLSLVVASSLVACSKKEPADKAAPAAQATGPLTAARIMEAAHQIDVYTPDGKPAPFAGALAQAKAVLGAPTHVDGTKYEWAVVEGDRCTHYRLEDSGGTATSPGSKGVPSSDAECLAATGKAPAAKAAP